MSTTPDDLVLSSQATQFVNEDCFRIRSEDDVLSEVSSVLEPHRISSTSQPGSHVRLCRVSTYVYHNDTVSKEGSNHHVVFPSFASHWAVFVTLPSCPEAYGHIYHLLFRDQRAANLSADKTISREVRFEGSTMHVMPEGAKEVGTTRFDHVELMRIGVAMIKAFGDYHRVFWNCQHFARMYLSFITDGHAKFDEWDFGNTANLFLCAFIITIPVVTTSKAVETSRKITLLEQVRKSTNSTMTDESDILATSDAAIDLARTLAEEEYRHSYPSLVKVKRTHGGVLDMIKEVITVIMDSLRLKAGKRSDE
jgi:hypothetical protein